MFNALPVKPGQQISLSLQDDLNDFVSDTSMLRKVLLNGLSNALKFSQKDVFLKASMHDQSLYMEIIDQGIGISEADEHHMLSVIGVASRRALIESIVPASIARRAHVWSSAKATSGKGNCSQTDRRMQELLLEKKCSHCR